MSKYWCANFGDGTVLEHGIKRKSWMMQYQYADDQNQHQGDRPASITRNWRQLENISEGDWLVAYLPKNTFYAIGKVRTPRRSPKPEDPRDTIEEYLYRRRSHDHESGYVYYTPVFYEDFSDEWRSEDGERWPQRIDVEEWLHYVPDGVELAGLAEYGPAEIQKAVFEINEKFFNKVRDKLATSPPSPKEGKEPEVKPPLAEMKTLLEQFGQIIAYGPPGTGKTREAKRVALALLGEEPAATASEKDIEARLEKYREQHRFDLAVFHPAYEYEQFVGGIEPKEIEGKIAFGTKAGVFLRLCRKAEKNSQPHVLIIDEINRGNLPKLLGELVYALEYRDHEVRLPFECDGDSTIVVPKNLYIIATMNSADRSIGHIDVAIRRRFGLYRMDPNPDVVREVWQEKDEEYGDNLAKLMEKLNAKLKPGNDSYADMEMGVGHSYFLPIPDSSVEDAKAQVGRKWTYQVLPLLQEYALLNPNADLQMYFKQSLESILSQS